MGAAGRINNVLLFLTLWGDDSLGLPYLYIIHQISVMHKCLSADVQADISELNVFIGMAVIIVVEVVFVLYQLL